MKKVLSIVLSVLLVTSIFARAIEVRAATVATKIDTALIDEINESETATSLAYVTLEDVDHDQVMETFRSLYPEEYAAFMYAEYDDPGDMTESEIAAIDDELLQSALEIKRSLYREAYSAMNTDIIESHYDDDEILFISQYAPVAIVETDVQSMRGLAGENGVVEVESYQYTTVDDEKVYVFYTEPFIDGIDLANEITGADIIRDTYDCTGVGVKIGVVEWNGVPDTQNPYLKSAEERINIRYKDRGNVSPHATGVVSILVAQDSQGNAHGIVPDAEIFCASCSNTTEFYEAVEWLISQQVNVINASLAVGGYSGYYDQVSQWVDHISALHAVHFVKSAGNDYSGNTLQITAPGMAYNAITVGAFDPNGTNNVNAFSMSYYSCYMETEINGPVKPNLVAPVCFYGAMSVDGVVEDVTGTSFAAPQVTGVIAQMCQYDSVLKFKQTTVGAILMASASRKVDAISTGNLGDSFISSVRVENNPQVSDKEGAGILDAMSAGELLYYGAYLSTSMYATSLPYTGSFLLDTSVCSTLRIVLFWLKKNTVSDHHSATGVKGAPLANLRLSIYAPDGTLVGQSDLTYANFEIVQINVEVSGWYTFKVSGTGSSVEYFGVAGWGK